MRIGVGITTYNRPRHLANCLAQLRKHSPPSLLIYVSDDTLHRKGVAYRKNQCLDALYSAGCDYLFLLDDDCFPIANGWIDFFLQAYQRTGQEHFCYTPPRFKMSVTEGLNFCEHSKGVCLFLTRSVVTRVGGFYEGYRLFGCEHTTYTQRIHRAGYTSVGCDLSIVGTERYLYAMDFDTSRSFNRELGHRSTVSEGEKVGLYRDNRAKVGEDVKQYVGLPWVKRGLKREEERVWLGDGDEMKGDNLYLRLGIEMRQRGYRVLADEERDEATVEVRWTKGDEVEGEAEVKGRYILIQSNLPFSSTLLSNALQVWETDANNLSHLHSHGLHPVLITPEGRIPWEIIETPE